MANLFGQHFAARFFRFLEWDWEDFGAVVVAFSADIEIFAQFCKFSLCKEQKMGYNKV